MGITSGFMHTFYIVNRRWSETTIKIDQVGIIFVNFSHQSFDSFLLFKVILNSPQLFVGAVGLEILFALYCIREILLRDRTTSYFWAILYPALSSTVLTTPLVAYSFQTSNTDLRLAAWGSLKCSAFVFIAGGLFFKGKFPERFWNPDGLFDYFNSHIWHHICIIFAICAGIEGFNAFRSLDAAQG